MSGIDRFRWVENELESVTIRCVRCDTAYTLELQDWEQIAIGGTVLCECGEWIQVEEILRSHRDG